MKRDAVPLLPTTTTRAAAVLAFFVVVLLAFFFDIRLAHAATFTVNSTNDPGTAGCDATECTLREAIDATNANNNAPTIDTIEFDIPSIDTNCAATTNVCTISPTSGGMSQITESLTIDGYSQTGASAATATAEAALKIELSGAGSPAGATGLRITTANSTVKGLVINRWTEGVRISDSGVPGDVTGNQVTGNYIGTDWSGTADLGNIFGVVVENAPENTIGGTTAGARNIISGNDARGVTIFDPGATGNEVIGNYIGIQKDGFSSRPNIFGVFIENAPGNTIGGTTAGASNTISGNGTSNSGSGVKIVGASATDNKVMGNYIGTDKNGTAKLGNNNSGVLIENASENTIGGTEAGARNVISGNNGNGVRIEGTGNKVMGNFIGTDGSGAQDLGNNGSGVLILARDNTIGGTAAGASNVISGNNGTGVFISGFFTTGNRILSNSIFLNNGGIGLNGGIGDAEGRTANDDMDPDFGPNNLQNFPVLASATTSGAQTTVQGTLNSTPNATFTVQLFSNPAGEVEGKTFLGEKTDVTTDPNGDASFDFVTPTPLQGGQVVSATATDPSGNTSEFSRAVDVVDNTPPPPPPPNTRPVITPLSPRPGATTFDATPLVRARVTDRQTNLAKSNIRLFVDNRAKPFSYNTSTDRLSYVSRRLSYGGHTVRIVANDKVFSTTRIWRFTVIRRR
jgi:titin